MGVEGERWRERVKGGWERVRESGGRGHTEDRRSRVAKAQIAERKQHNNGKEYLKGLV